MASSLRILFFAVLAAILVASAAMAQDVVALWPDGAPDAFGDLEVDRPTITIYRPAVDAVNSTAVLVFPGGGYVNLAMDHEGRQIAEWLNARGITAVVLRYRLGPRYRHPAPLSDARRAIQYVRSHAEELAIDPSRIGVWGFSAGGHLASTASTHFIQGDSGAVDPVERVSSRPDFAILAYPVVSLAESYTHIGSRNALLGEEPHPALLHELSSERQVTELTPPTFLFHTDEDAAVPAENSIAYYLALREAGVPAELHVYRHGRHGVGLALDDPILATWSDRLDDWLRTQNLIE